MDDFKLEYSLSALYLLIECILYLTYNPPINKAETFPS